MAAVFDWLKSFRKAPRRGQEEMLDYDLLEALADPKHPEHANLLEWIGGPFDPTAFDLTGVDRAIKTIKP